MSLQIRPTGIHPAATIFPMMHGAQLGRLVGDIAKNGLLEPIVVQDGLLLDGRNRLYACELAGVEPRFVEWQGEGSPVAFVLSCNLHRRHLDESQRAAVGARAKAMFVEEAANREHAHQFGSRAETTPNGVVSDEKRRVSSAGANLHRPQRSNEQAAALLNVSARSVATATRVLALGDERIVAAIDAGQITISDAAAVIKLPKTEQRRVLDAVRSGSFRTLRQAAAALARATSLQAGGALPEPAVVDPEAGASFSRGQLRAACKRFAAECEKLRSLIDRAAVAHGGANDPTRRIRDALAVAHRAAQECLNDLGRLAERPSTK